MNALPITATKICARCCEDRRIDQFRPNRWNVDGLAAICNVCIDGPVIGKSLSVRRFGRRVSEHINEVVSSKRPLVITQWGKPLVAVVEYAWFERAKAALGEE